MNGVKPQLNNHLPLGSEIIHSIHFDKESEGLIALLRAKVSAPNESVPRLSSVRDYTIMEPSGETNLEELQAYCADVNIALPEPKLSAEALKQAIPELLIQRDAFNPSDKNEQLSQLIDQLLEMDLTEHHETIKSNLLYPLLEALDRQTNQRRPLNSIDDAALIARIETARSALLSLINSADQNRDGPMSSKIEDFNATLQLFFTDISWCRARETANRVDWFPVFKTG